MSTCVNLSLKEFKDCCERLNVSAATLEPIVHEYINTVGGENSFPTDAYIERVIHGSEQPVLSEEQVTLWEKRYSQPAQFNDVLEAMSHITEAERFFPRESIGLKETLDGKVEVRVTKPVYVGPNTSLEEFAREQERQAQELKEVQQRDAIEAEKLLIKQKAIADGTFMLAPNGKPTNLTEDQWLSVRTKAFKEWFGDWENDPKNASKVVDENGEPLVVYHGGSLVNVFDTSGNAKGGAGIQKGITGAYFTTSKSAAENYADIHDYKVGDTLFDAIEEFKEQGLTDAQIDKEFNTSLLGLRSGVREFFLNIRNPRNTEYLFKIKERTVDGSIIQSISNEATTIKDINIYDNDGQIIKLIRPSHKSIRNDGKKFFYKETIEFEYVAKDSNQIKSATDNIGAFSTTDNNVYHNKNLKDRYNRLLEYVKQHIGDKDFSLKDFNYHWGTNFGFNPKTKEITTRDERIHGVSIWNPNDTKVEAKKKIDRVQLLNYLSAKFGLKFKEVSNEEYTKKAGSLSNCCVIGDTVYIRKGDKNKLTNEQLIEEFLHPLVNAIYNSNQELTNNLLEEAKKLFPDLTKQIAVAYTDQSKQVQDEELITQVLSKYLNKEISDKGVNTRTIANYIKQFFESILDLVRDLFGDVRIEKDTRLKISGKDIKTVFNFENLAQLINSKEITFTDTLGKTEWRNNRTPQEFTFNDGVTVKTSLLNYISEDVQLFEEVIPAKEPIRDSYDEIFTPKQPVQPIQEKVVEEESSLLEEYQQNAEFYSGKADGSDQAWGQYLRELGLNVKDFTVEDYDALSNEEKNVIEKEYVEARAFLGKPTLSGYPGKLTRRDMLQADKADAIFAIAERIVRPGEAEKSGGKSYVNKTRHENVSGGTANAVARGILRNIPVYVYDMSEGKWKMWDSNTSTFVITKEPTLTPHAAVIGTRDNRGVTGPNALRQEGHDAIKTVIEKTFNPIEIEETIEDEVEQQYEEKKKEIDKAVKEAEEFITANNSFSEQVENLINSTDVNQSEITELANEVSYYMSDLITQWQDNPKAFFENFPTKRKETEEESIKWFNSLSRKQIVESIGIGNFLTIVKDRLFNDLNYDNLSDEEIDILDAKAMLFYENFDALLRFGMSAFRSIEDFNINYSEVGYKVENVEKIDNNAEGNEFDNTNVEVVEDLGDKQEHWQIDSRTIDNFLSMSQIVKRELTRCYITEIDENGNTVNKVNSFGVNKRVDPKQATGKILRWVQGAITLEQMIDKLKERQKSNPWLSQIINKLEDKSGKYTDLQGQFFSVFCKHFQEYYYILETKDKQGNRIMSTRSANINPALKDIMSSIEVSFRLHQHPLFDAKGVISNKFNNLIKDYNKLAELNKQPFETLNIEQVCTGISYVAEILGYNVSPEDIAWVLNEESLNSMLVAVSSIIDNVRKEVNNPNYDPFAFRGENSIGGYLRTFLTPITEHLEDIAISSFYDSGKMYQSYVIPSYLTKLMKKFKESTDEEFKTFLKEEYGDYEWFRDTSDKKMRASSWKNVWLRQLASMDSKKRKELFGHKVLLNYNGHNYMRNMTSPEYILATLTEFLSGSSTDKEGTSTAWYKIPMMSNKPSFEFIKFLRYKGADYKDTLTTHLVNVFTQEFERIQTVLMRGYSKSDSEYIKNFDENGKRFMFLEYLNPYLDHLNGELRGSELGKLINKKLKTELNEEENGRLDTLLKEVIKTQMEAKADAIIAQYKANGVFDLAKNIENIGKTNKDIENAIKNFVWNDTFASINILQLTITDTAYYANAEDVQKRLAQIHAPGMRGNVEATDYDGNLVSDGTFRTIFLKDFDKVKSNIIENLEIVFDRKIEQASENEKEFWRNTKEAIIKQFKDINVADAQAYNSPTSYRKKAFMFGKWSKKSEEIYQKLKKGEYNLLDLETAFQPLKPFVYSQATKKSGVEGSPIQNMKVNMQFKNSEYLLIMADAILQGEKTGKPNLLRAIYEVMEESAEKYPTQGIDTVQFESAVKAGLHATIDLNQCLEIENGEQIAKKLMETAIYNEERGYYNTTYVHETPFEDYTIQQEVPAHFKDHEQAHGSQERMIIPSDLARIDANGKTVYYTFTDNGVTKSLTAEEFRKEYEETIAENIQESIDRLYDELGLNIPNKKVRNVALSKILQKEILSSPRYGMDLYIACSVDKDGNFNIPLGDPIQSKRIEQLINSIIKNRVNKQKVAGGPVVQVTNYGTSTQLHIKFKDKKGNILPTLTEWLEKNPGKTAEDFKKYLEDNQGGVAYYECYAPAYMQELLQDFMDEHGELDIEAIEAANPELLDMIGYRIPSEDLYSVAPLRIKGFLPKEAGEGIMLPYEITLITGSDFDIDKFYLMRKEFDIKRRKTKEIEELLVEEFGESKRKVIQTFLHLIKTDKFDTFKKYPKYAKAYRRLAFIAEKPTKGKAYRNNKIIDMSLAVLTHETATDRLLNPGGFEPQKRMGYLIQAYKLGKGTWKELDAKSTNELKKICMTDKNLSYIDVNTQFYEQNNVAGTILGMFAVQKVAHSTLEGDKLCVNVSDILGLPEGKSFGIAGKRFTSYMEFDGTNNVRGEFIGKVLGSLVAAAADAVKDPVLNLMNINSTTVNVLTALIRLGVPFETASLLTSQDVITECLQEFNLKNLSGFISFRDVLNEKLAKLTEGLSEIEGTNDINYENLSKAEMIQGLTPNASIEVKYKGLLTFIRALDIAMELKGPTYATRFNSISNAVGPLVANNIVMKHKVDSFSKHIYKRIKDGSDTEAAQYVPIEIQDIFEKHPILARFHETLAIADTVFDDYIPANSDSFDAVLSNLPENIRGKIMGDTKALGQLIDFYLSYLLINSGCINTNGNKDLNYYMNEFPKSFVTEKLKDKYPNNPLIQAIKVTTSQASDGSTRYTLVINTTGMDNIDKERLSSGWTDLYNTDPHYALRLFEYNFYKGGIGFTPKTFMHLLPINIKRKIPHYIETFRHLPNVNYELIIDQFIRNNWQNGKFVPRLNEENVIIDKDSVILNKENYNTGLSTSYIRIRFKDKTEKLYKKDNTDVSAKSVTYKEISPLGNNGEYLEINNYNIEESMDSKPKVLPGNTPNIPSYTNQELDNDSVESPKINETEKKNYEDILLKVLGKETLAKFRSKTKEDQMSFKEIYKDHFDALFAKKGVPYNPEEFEEIFKQFCGN